MVKRLLVLNGLAIICVILFHAGGWGFVAMFSWAHRYLPASVSPFDQVGSLGYYGLRLIEQLVQFSIAAFLFVSGFFTAFSTGQNRPTLEWKTIFSRIKFLVIPYLFWTGILMVALILEGRIPSLSQIPVMILTGGANPAYYFVPLLVQLYLLAPFLVPLARKHWKALLISTAILQVGVLLLTYSSTLNWQAPIWSTLNTMLPKWVFLVRLFWFAAGMVVGFHLPRIKPFITRFRTVWLSAAVGFFILGFFEWEWLQGLSGQPWLQGRETIIDGFYAAAFILSIISFIEIKLPFSEEISALGTKSFGIYLVHSPVMEYLSRGIYHFAPQLLAHQIILQPLLILFGLGIPLLLMAAVKKSPARPLYSYQFG